MDLIPQFAFGGGRIGNAPFFNTGQAPFTNFNTTYDVVANLTKVMGTHAAKVGFYFQKSLKDQSAFANHNGRYRLQQQHQQPVRLPAPLRERGAGHLQLLLAGVGVPQAEVAVHATSRCTSRTTGGRTTS